MSTKARVTLRSNGEEISTRHFLMDGYVENWSSQLIEALNQTTPKSILDNSSLFRFMFNDYDEDDDFLSYLCDIEVLEDDYYIKVYGFDKELNFEGSLDEFSMKYC